MSKKHFFRTLLIVFIATMFLADIVRMATAVSGTSESYHQRSINAAFHSAFGVFELIMIGIMAYAIRRFPKRRVRLLSLLFFHVVGVLILPMATRNFTFMALMVPWPQTLLPFDHKTPFAVMAGSLVIGFAVIPAITLLWGRKAFCGYVCPIGGFYSETLGRLFSPPPGRAAVLRAVGPPAMFVLMSAALVTILVWPLTLEPLRAVQKVLFFAVSQVLYFCIGIPLVGARSYCTHLCPLGFGIGLLVNVKRKLLARGRWSANIQGTSFNNRQPW